VDQIHMKYNLSFATN